MQSHSRDASSFDLMPRFRGFLEGCRAENLPIGRTGTLHAASLLLNPLGTCVALRLRAKMWVGHLDAA